MEPTSESAAKPTELVSASTDNSIAQPALLATGQVQGQGELTNGDNLEAKQYKTLGIRVDNELHAKLSFISQLRDSTLQGEIVQAVRDRVEAAQTDPELIAKAAEVRAQIEAEARARQEAIAGMFGSTALSSETDRPTRTSRRGTRTQSTEPTA